MFANMNVNMKMNVRNALARDKSVPYLPSSSVRRYNGVSTTLFPNKQVTYCIQAIKHIVARYPQSPKQKQKQNQNQNQKPKADLFQDQECEQSTYSST